MLDAHDLPSERPRGLRLTILDVPWFRVDDRPPRMWSWSPHSAPRSRFDPAGGGHRVRYAAGTLRGAIRERFHDDRRWITAAGLEARVVEVRGRVRVLDLRQERVLDALRVDDEINVGRSHRVLRCSQHLATLLPQWFETRCDGVVYRSRTTPETSVNLAFFSWAPLTAIDIGALADQQALLANLVADDGFRVDLPGWT